MGARLYRLLARLLPAGFRKEYGDEMCRVAEEQWAARRSVVGSKGAWGFWLRQSSALLRAAAGLHRHEHETTGGMTMEGFASDLRQAVRALGRRPGFALLTVLTLGLGIGATTAIFSAVNTVILRPLPYAGAEQVTVLIRTDSETGERGGGVSAPNIRDIREEASAFEQIAVAEPWSLDLQVDGRAVSLRTWSVSRGFFQAIGADPLLGRTFVEADYDSEEPIVVVGHRAWVNRFDSDPSILGRALTLDGEARTVVGVMGPDFRFPDAAEMWIPRLPQPWDDTARSADFMTGVARLRAGVSTEQARSETNQLARGLEEAYPEANDNLGYELLPLREFLFGDVRTPLYVLMAAVGFVLLIACANVAGLMLARGAQRERDYALRGALGAGTGRLVGHVLAESLILAAAGCLLGVLLTYAGVAIIGALGPDHLPRIDELSVDRPVLLFAVAVSALSALISALAPSLRLSKPNLRDALGDGSRGAGAGKAEGRARGRLVVSQVAGAVVLLVGAGLLLRSFGALVDNELGFDPTDRVAIQIFAYDYETSGDRLAVIDQAIDGMRALPGVRSVGLTTDLPGATDGTIAKIDVLLPFVIEDRDPPPAGQEPIAAVTGITEDYFDAMGIEVIEGRSFDSGDNPDGTPVIMINAALARRHFGEESPVGQRIEVQSRTPRSAEIVGVVSDTRPLGHASEPRPEIYRPFRQAGSGSLTFVVAAAPGAGDVVQSSMEAIWAANPAQSIYGAVPYETLMIDWLRERRFNLFLLSAFSVIALVLSAIGIYGLVSFSVERRMGELGIRRALGGQSGDLLGMVLGQGIRLAVTGLAIGLAVSWYLNRFIRGMLFEVEPYDPTTLVGLGVLVLAIAISATMLPAVRAMRVDPVEALRSE